jgi:hypothetical protein
MQIDNNDDSKLHNDNNQKGPMMSYKITDDEINWKKETETDTTVTNATASAPAPEEHLLWNKFALDGNKHLKAALKSNIAEALHVSHSRYIKMKRLTNAQKQEKETIELGMLSIMQMHCNETNAKNDKNWKDTLNDIVTCYHTEVKSIDEIDDDGSDMPDETNKQEVPADATDVIDMNDDDDDSDDDDKKPVNIVNTVKDLLFLMMMRKMMTLTRRNHLIKDQVTKKWLGLIEMIQQQLRRKNMTQEKPIIKMLITLNNERKLINKRVVMR